MKPEIYLMRTLTPTHVGAGSGLGHIDLPIYREAHTDFPAIPASAIKGVFRTRWIYELLRNMEDIGLKASHLETLIEGGKDKLNENIKKLKDRRELMNDIPEGKRKEIMKLIELFGSKDSEGKLTFSDARILFFPVRSLKGIYALITCPYVIRRFCEDTQKDISNIPEPNNEECITLSDKVIVNFGGNEFVVLEEFSFKVSNKETDWEPPEDVDKDRVVIVSDDVFKHMVKSYTEVQTHIKVDIEKGTVRQGGLWFEEYLPAESILYFALFKNGVNYQIQKETLQIGGNSSTGKGFVEVFKYENS